MTNEITYEIRPTAMEDPIYVCGPMTGILLQNYPAFNAVTAVIRRAGKIVYNPAENFGGLTGLPRSAYMRVDLTHLLHACSIVVLPGYEDSAGAQLELTIAEELELLVYICRPDSYHFDLGDIYDDNQ